jgi:hypothetical protein
MAYTGAADCGCSVERPNNTVAVVLVLFILLVIIARAFNFGW